MVPMAALFDCEGRGELVPPLPPVFPPLPLPPSFDGAVGVNVAAVFDKHWLTAESTAVRELGAPVLTDALPAKLQEAALRSVSS